MAWRKSPQSLIDLFGDVLPDDSRLERRKMFGYPAAFVNGNMCMGLHQEDFIVRLSLEDRTEIKNMHGAALFEPMAGRTMREYVALPEKILADEAALQDWVARSFAFVAQMPPKEKKRRKMAKKKIQS
jgi:TfoX/Sxy family transcriptional regulator of competence genes